MNNCLLTLNLNNHLTENARSSFQFACQKWKCCYEEIAENLVGDQNICFNKLKAVDILSKKYCGILYVDADILIRSDTPNPFELFTDRNFVYAIKDVYPHYEENWLKNTYRSDVIDPWLKKSHEILKLTTNFDSLSSTVYDWFFNAGVFLCYPSNIQHELNLFLNNIPGQRVSGRIEQAMWNYILKCRNKVKLIEYEWNRIQPDISSGKMNCYIYHFTGFKWKELKEALPKYDWTI